jgi:hypothetical protein
MGRCEMRIGRKQAKVVARFLELAAENADHVRLNLFYRSWSKGDMAFLQAIDENGEELACMLVDECLGDAVKYSGDWNLDGVK